MTAEFLDSQLDALPWGLRAARRLPSGLIREVEQARGLARVFNREVAGRRSLEIDQAVQTDPSYLPRDVVEAANARGFYSLWLPKAFGGGGLSPLSMLAFSEELATECLGIANLIGSHYVGISLVSAAFDFRALRMLCRGIKAGERAGRPCLVSTAITEPDAGTDVEDIDLIDRGSVRCRAEKVEGGYRLHGTKIFISNAHLSTWHVVTAYADLARPSESAVILLVRTGDPGFTLGRIEGKMGQAASPAGVLHFDGCFVPEERVCLERAPDADAAGHRSACAMLSEDVLAMSRPGVAALSAGAARGALRRAMEHCQETLAGGRRMVDQEWAQSRLAEMYKNVKLSQYCAWEAALETGLEGPFRAMLSRAAFALLKILPGTVARAVLGPLLVAPAARARMRADRAAIHDRGADAAYSAHASLAKFGASDLALENCRIAMQLMGQAGFRSEGRLEKILRDARLLQIYEGSNSFNRLNLFKHGMSRDLGEARVYES